MFSHLSVGYRGKNKAHVVWSGSREPLWKLLWNRCAINVDCRLADWQVNGVNIAVKCSNRFSIPKTSLLDNHIKHTVSGCYATLSILRKLKCLPKYELRKQLAAKIDFVKTRLCRSSFLPSTTILTSTFATKFNLLPQVLYSVTMLRTFGMYLKSDGFQSMREEIWTSWNHALKLCITLRLGQIILK